MRKYIIAGLIFFAFIFIACGGRGQSTDSPEVKYTLANKINYDQAEPELTSVVVEFDAKSINLQKDQCLSVSKSQMDGLRIIWRSAIICNNIQGNNKCPSSGHYEIQASGSGVDSDYDWKAPELAARDTGAENCIEFQ